MRLGSRSTLKWLPVCSMTAIRFWLSKAGEDGVYSGPDCVSAPPAKRLCRPICSRRAASLASRSHSHLLRASRILLSGGHEGCRCHLQLVHLGAAEGIGVREQRFDRLCAAGGQVAEVAGVGAQEGAGLVVDLGLLTVEEGLDRVDQVFLGVDQSSAKSKSLRYQSTGLPATWSRSVTTSESCATNG
jgi:hypothetical protein